MSVLVCKRKEDEYVHGRFRLIIGMKVIIASFPKCGTKTLHKCLELLGYSVCDHDDAFVYHAPQWEEIFLRGGSVEIFKQMYEKWDAVCDIPPCYYWEEISEAFPDAKIILTTRKSDEDWMRSFSNHKSRLENNKLFRAALAFTPTGRKYLENHRQMGRIIFGSPPQDFATCFRQENEEIQKKRYREHNFAVLHRAPKDKLLVFNLSDGWEPLCKFLEKEVPDAPFPWENSGGAMADAILDIPLFAGMLKELYLLCGFLSFLLSFGLYALFSQT